jgi:hypothetical protein
MHVERHNSDLAEQILGAWRLRNRIMLFMIRNTPDDALTVTLSTRGGRDVARQEAPRHIDFYDKEGDVMEKYIMRSLQDTGAVSNLRQGVIPMIAHFA